tara:strand:- start:457 stop:720 length:264 start_codon:yes stop_codon:yes gene_type:complete
MTDKPYDSTEHIEKLATKGRGKIKRLKEKYREGMSEMDYKTDSLQTLKGAQEYNTPYPEVPTVKKKNGGRIRGSGIARKGTRKCKMR